MNQVTTTHNKPKVEDSFNDKMKNYNNFTDELKKEQDSTAQHIIQAFYHDNFHKWRAEYIDYSTPYGRILQHAGVDRVLTKENSYGSITSQLWIQEKITFKKYNKLLFEYEKRSGAEGWAISYEERADWLVYYMDGTIYLINFKKLREWLRDNLEEFKASYRFDTDNKNVIIPIDKIRYNMNKESTGFWEFTWQG